MRSTRQRTPISDYEVNLIIGKTMTGPPKRSDASDSMSPLYSTPPMDTKPHWNDRFWLTDEQAQNPKPIRYKNYLDELRHQKPSFSSSNKTRAPTQSEQNLKNTPEPEHYRRSIDQPSVQQKMGRHTHASHSRTPTDQLVVDQQVIPDEDDPSPQHAASLSSSQPTSPFHSRPSTHSKKERISSNPLSPQMPPPQQPPSSPSSSTSSLPISTSSRKHSSTAKHTSKTQLIPPPPKTKDHTQSQIPQQPRKQSTRSTPTPPPRSPHRPPPSKEEIDRLIEEDERNIKYWEAFRAPRKQIEEEYDAALQKTAKNYRFWREEDEREREGKEMIDEETFDREEEEEGRADEQQVTTIFNSPAPDSRSPVFASSRHLPGGIFQVTRDVPMPFTFKQKSDSGETEEIEPVLRTTLYLRRVSNRNAPSAGKVKRVQNLSTTYGLPPSAQVYEGEREGKGEGEGEGEEETEEEGDESLPPPITLPRPLAPPQTPLQASPILLLLLFFFLFTVQ